MAKKSGQTNKRTVRLPSNIIENMETDGSDVANIHYFIREKYFGNALFYCDDALDRRQQDGHLVLLKAYCLSKLGENVG